jgi:hypothetical protein
LENREEENRQDVQNECQSGLLERPPWDLLPAIHANPIIAATERELRETIRARMNIGYGGPVALSYRRITCERFRGLMIPEVEK